MIHHSIDSIFTDLTNSLSEELESRSVIETLVSEVNDALRPLMLGMAKFQSSVPYIVGSPQDSNDSGNENDKENKEEEADEIEYMAKVSKRELVLGPLQQALQKLVTLKVDEADNNEDKKKIDQLKSESNKNVVDEPVSKKKSKKESKEKKKKKDKKSKHEAQSTSEDSSDKESDTQKQEYSKNPNSHFIAYHKYQSIWTEVVEESIEIVLMKHFVETCLGALEPFYTGKYENATKDKKNSKNTESDNKDRGFTTSLSNLDPSALSKLLATPEQVSQMLGVPFSYLYSEYICEMVTENSSESYGSNTRGKSAKTFESNPRFRKPPKAESSAAFKDATLFHLSVTDYLHAVLSMSSKLSRLAFNCVTTVSQVERVLEQVMTELEEENKKRKYDEREDHGINDSAYEPLKDGQRPQVENNFNQKSWKNQKNELKVDTHKTLSPYFFAVIISSFLKQVQSGFMSLDFKNDNLRRHVDVLKYDVKGAEQVVYDLSLRGLI